MIQRSYSKQATPFLKHFGSNSAAAAAPEIWPEYQIHFRKSPTQAVMAFRTGYFKQHRPMEIESNIQRITRAHVPFYVLRADITVSVSYQVGYKNGLRDPSTNGFEIVDAFEPTKSLWLQVPPFTYSILANDAFPPRPAFGVPVHDKDYNLLKNMATVAPYSAKVQDTDGTPLNIQYAGPYEHNLGINNILRRDLLASDFDSLTWDLYQTLDETRRLPFEISEKEALEVFRSMLAETIQQKTTKDARMAFTTSHVRNINVDVSLSNSTVTPVMLPAYIFETKSPIFKHINKSLMSGVSGRFKAAFDVSPTKALVVPQAICYLGGVSWQLGLLASLPLLLSPYIVSLFHAKRVKLVEETASERRFLDTTSQVDSPPKETSLPPPPPSQAPPTHEPPKQERPIEKRFEQEAFQRRHKIRSIPKFTQQQLDEDSPVTSTRPSAKLKKRQKSDPLGLYAYLGLSGHETTEEISAAFILVAKKLHPDSQPATGNKERATAAFQKLLEFSAILRDENKRAHYDKTGKLP